MHIVNILVLFLSTFSDITEFRHSKFQVRDTLAHFPLITLTDKNPLRVVLTRSNFMVGDLYVYSTQKVTEKVLTELTLR